MPKRKTGPLPSVSAAVLVVLNWWCEETDHTADGICNLLSSHQQLTLTSDPTQLRGLEVMMSAHAPRTPMEYTRDITSLFNSYCKASETFTDPSKKSEAQRLCADRAQHTMDNLFKVPPKSWQPIKTGNGMSAPDNRKLPATRMVELDGSLTGEGAATAAAAQQRFTARWQRKARSRAELR